MRRYRSTIIAVLLGIVLLVVVAGFAIALPELTGDDSGDVADAIPETVLDGRLVSVDDLDPAVAERAKELRDFGAERLSDVFETDVAVQIYATEDLQAQAEVTVAAGGAGFYKVGLPTDPESADSQGSWYQLETYGDATCYTVWGPEQQTAATGGLPLSVFCQREDGGRVIDVRSGGLTAEETAAIVDEIAG